MQRQSRLCCQELGKAIFAVSAVRGFTPLPAKKITLCQAAPARTKATLGVVPVKHAPFALPSRIAPLPPVSAEAYLREHF